MPVHDVPVHPAGELRSQPAGRHTLEAVHQAIQYGRTFARIGRFEPTSQVCSACGVKDGPKPLHVREWTCAACGTAHDRDVNAARNILAAGRADKSNGLWSRCQTAPCGSRR